MDGQSVKSLLKDLQEIRKKIPEKDPAPEDQEPEENGREEPEDSDEQEPEEPELSPEQKKDIAKDRGRAGFVKSVVAQIVAYADGDTGEAAKIVGAIKSGVGDDLARRKKEAMKRPAPDPEEATESRSIRDLTERLRWYR